MSRPKRGDTVVKLPIGGVVREHRIGAFIGATPELEAIERASISVRGAVETLWQQEATLNLLAAQARKR
jgi:hypothetical protein